MLDQVTDSMYLCSAPRASGSLMSRQLNVQHLLHDAVQHRSESTLYTVYVKRGVCKGERATIEIMNTDDNSLNMVPVLIGAVVGLQLTSPKYFIKG